MITANERRIEIIRILVARRYQTMAELALELGVTDRTIRNDITILTVNYPLETIRGNGGGVKIADWYHPHKNFLSREHQTVLIQMMDKADQHEFQILLEILAEFGAPMINKTLLQKRGEHYDG